MHVFLKMKLTLWLFLKGILIIKSDESYQSTSYTVRPWYPDSVQTHFQDKSGEQEEKRDMKIVKHFYQLLKNNCCQAAGLVNFKKNVAGLEDLFTWAGL